MWITYAIAPSPRSVPLHSGHVPQDVPAPYPTMYEPDSIRANTPISATMIRFLVSLPPILCAGVPGVADETACRPFHPAITATIRHASSSSAMDRWNKTPPPSQLGQDGCASEKRRDDHENQRDDGAANDYRPVADIPPGFIAVPVSENRAKPAR